MAGTLHGQAQGPCGPQHLPGLELLLEFTGKALHDITLKSICCLSEIQVSLGILFFVVFYFLLNLATLVSL